MVDALLCYYFTSMKGFILSIGKQINMKMLNLFFTRKYSLLKSSVDGLCGRRKSDIVHHLLCSLRGSRQLHPFHSEITFVCKGEQERSREEWTREEVTVEAYCHNPGQPNSVIEIYQNKIWNCCVGCSLHV